MKGTVISNFANVKTMDGSAMSPALAMQIGDYVFGAVSVTGSDLVNFDHFYRANNTRVEIGKLCKASVSNMRLDNVSEPGSTPPPPPPTTGAVLTHTIEVYSDGSIKIDGNSYP